MRDRNVTISSRLANLEKETLMPTNVNPNKARNWKTVTLRDDLTLPFVEIWYETNVPGEPIQGETCVLEDGKIFDVEPGVPCWRKPVVFNLFGNPFKVLPDSDIKYLMEHGRLTVCVGKMKVTYLLLEDNGNTADPIEVWRKIGIWSYNYKVWSEKQRELQLKKEANGLEAETMKLRKEAQELRKEIRQLEDERDELRGRLSRPVKVVMRRVLNWLS